MEEHKMPIFRINKTKNYTIMSNYHLKDKKLSFKAKGLLSYMLSLPDDWDYSLRGLCIASKDNQTSIKSAINELKEHKYMDITKERNNKGMFRRYVSCPFCQQAYHETLDDEAFLCMVRLMVRRAFESCDDMPKND